MNLVVNWKIFEKRTSSYGGVRIFNGEAGKLREALANIMWRKTNKMSAH